jgi:hypothetical protein
MDTENQPLTKAGKSMRKLIQKREENAMYDDSDEEKNPYASSVSDAMLKAIALILIHKCWC